METAITAPDVAVVITSIGVIGGALLSIQIAKKGWREVLNFFR